MHLFLSPHLDDAALSCGGLIHRLIQSGQPVVVRTIMSGIPPEGVPDTELTRDLHSRWQAGTNPVLIRRQEDSAALQVLGATAEYLDVYDCPYRLNAQGQALYPSQNDIFGPAHSEDPARTIVLELTEDLEAIYAPLGAGGHVDHKIVCGLARSIATQVPVYYYEEYPYSAESGEAVRITGDPAVQLFGSQAVGAALENFSGARMKPRVVLLSEANLAAKVQSIAAYRSQISTFWDDLTDMDRRVRLYARQIALPGAERLWF